MPSSEKTSQENDISGKGRLIWIDGIKFLLAFLVFFTHMSAMLSIDLGVFGQVFYGFTGKYAVAGFSVILGFFANKTAKSNSDLSIRILRRYVQFVFPLLIVTGMTSIIYALLNIERNSILIALNRILTESFLVGENSYCPQAWCIKDFFIASLIIYVLSGKRYRNVIWVLLFIILTLAGKVWIAVCLLGAILKEIHVSTNKKLPFEKYGVLFSLLKVSLIAFSFMIIRFPENLITYLFNGISAALLLWICLNSSVLKRILSVRILSAGGKISFEFFLVHIGVYNVTKFVMDLFLSDSVSHNILVWIIVLASFCISAGLAYMLSLLTKRINKMMISHMW